MTPFEHSYTAQHDVVLVSYELISAAIVYFIALES